MWWLLLTVLLVLTTQAVANDEPRGLLPGPGRDVVEASCGACHTVDYIRMNSPFLTTETWKAEITKMRTAFAAPIDDEAANAVLTYLTAHYAAPPKP